MDECRQLYKSTNPLSSLLLKEILSFIHRRDGKMMRPMMLLLCAKLFGNTDLVAVRAAVAYEFFHTASLVHDDVVDDSDERRGQASVNKLFNNKRAVLAGDYILSNCLEQLSLTGIPRLVNILSVAAKSLANGELLQLSCEGNASEADYIEIIRNKTAALFTACAQSGAVLGGASEEDIEKMRVFGDAVGICFQIKDDLLDEEIDPQRAQVLLDDYLSLAKLQLDTFPDSEIKQSLLAYVDYVVEREK